MIKRDINRYPIYRIFINITIFTTSLLAIFKAPTSLFWKLSIVETEWGHTLSALSLLTLLVQRKRTKLRRFTNILSIIASIISLSPLIRALFVARRLPRQILEIFGEIPSSKMLRRSTPLSIRDLLLGIRVPSAQCTTLVYGAREDLRLEMDVYHSCDIKGKTPCVLMIHGGSWQHRDKTQLSTFNHYLAACGYTVAAINYRLAPAHRFPAALEDVAAALEFLRVNATELGIDPQRFVLMGRSSGGHLALLAAYTARDSGVRGVISLYGPTDLYYGYQHPASPAVLDTRGILEDFLGGSPEQLPSIYAEASPITFVGPKTPPTLLIHGGRDELVQPVQSERLARCLAQFGRSHLLLRLPWATHAADFNFSGPASQLMLYGIERFLAVITV